MRMYPPESTNPIEREFTLEEVLRAAFELHKQATRAAIEKHPEAKKSFVRETLLTPDPFIHDRRDAYLAYLNSVQKR